MSERGNQAAWLRGIREQFLLKCREHAEKVIRLVER